MSLASTLADSALGSVQKALLIIHKLDASQIDSSQVAASAANALQGAAAGMAATSAAMQGAGMNTSVMKVQYNPTSLSIQANAEAIPFTYLQQNIDSGVPNQSPRPSMVVLSVELIFVAMNL